MYFRNVYFATAFRAMTAVFLFYGILCHFSFSDGYVTAHNLTYFTVQSNIFCFICMCVFLFRTKKGVSEAMVSMKYAATLCILVTFLCFHYVILSSETYTGTLFSLQMKNFIAHYLSPLLMLLDWLLFQPKGKLSWYSPILWLICPLTYLLIIVTRASFNSPEVFARAARYPYFFLDIDRIGSQVYIYILLYLALFVFLGYLFLIVDKILAAWVFIRRRSEVPARTVLAHAREGRFPFLPPAGSQALPPPAFSENSQPSGSNLPESPPYL